MLFFHPALAHQPMLSTFCSRPLTPKHLKNLRISAVTAMLEVNCNNASPTNPSSPTIFSCPTVTAGSDQLKVSSVATSNSLFLEDLPGRSETVASPSVFCSADDSSGMCPSVIRAKVKGFCACWSSFSSNALGIWIGTCLQVSFDPETPTNWLINGR